MIPVSTPTPIATVAPNAAEGDGREFPFTPADFERIADMLRGDTGISLSQVKAPLVYSRLVQRVRELGLASFQDYCARLDSSTGLEERRRLASLLTTNITRFFREPHHFTHLRGKVLPGLIDLARRGGRVRLWSAGCSSGQEPYSIAMTLLSEFPDAAQFDIKILAVDIDSEMLAHGRAALYDASAMETVPPPMRESWFTAEPGPGRETAWRAAPALRNLVTFRELNLVGNWPMRGPFHAVFCRNTVIYFEDDAQRRIWAAMGRVCAPGSALYIGHSERLSGTDVFRADGPTTYLRVEGA